MMIKIDSSGLKQTNVYEYALRFIAGGAITFVAGLIARKWGPGIGGLLLAFPAVFPASATLIEKHERLRKQKKGLHGEERGIDAAAIDALGPHGECRPCGLRRHLLVAYAAVPGPAGSRRRDRRLAADLVFYLDHSATTPAVIVMAIGTGPDRQAWEPIWKRNARRYGYSDRDEGFRELGQPPHSCGQEPVI